MEDGSLKNSLGIKSALFVALCGLASCGLVQNAPAGADDDAQALAGPNIDKFEAYTQRFPDSLVMTGSHATGHARGFFFTHSKDGGGTSLTFDKDGGCSVTWEGGRHNDAR